MGILEADDVDVVPLCYVPNNRMLGSGDALHIELRMCRARPMARKVIRLAFLTSVRDWTGILHVLPMDPVSRWHYVFSGCVKMLA